MRLIQSLFLALFVFGLIGWLYVAVNAWVHSESLNQGLTHLTPWIREDTFGVLCFIISFVSFFVWLATRPSKLD
jgi:hypothetical protein